jgi:hypothetical protein
MSGYVLPLVIVWQPCVFVSNNLIVGFEVLTAVVIKSSACYQCHSGFLLGLFLNPENECYMFL